MFVFSVMCTVIAGAAWLVVRISPVFQEFRGDAMTVVGVILTVCICGLLLTGLFLIVDLSVSIRDEEAEDKLVE